MDQEHRRPPAARWLQPQPVPFWGTRLFRWNLIACSSILAIAAAWLLLVEPKLAADARAKARREHAAQTYAPRDPSSKEPRDVRFEGMLDKAKDDVGPEVRDEPYRYLVKYLATVDPSRLASQAREVDYELLKAQPEEMRGLTARLHLQYWDVPDLGPVRLDKPVGSVETVTRAYFATSSAKANEIYIVDFVEPLPKIEKESFVILDAVFLRRVSYERAGLKETKFHQAPLFLARGITKVQPAKTPAQFRFLPVAVLLGVALLAFLSFLTVKMFLAARSGGPIR